MSYIEFWIENALANSKVNYFYSDTTTNGLVYNLYADTMLGLGFVPDEVYTAVTTYYDSIITGEC